MLYVTVTGILDVLIPCQANFNPLLNTNSVGFPIL